jgi:hypothetical protein
MSGSAQRAYVVAVVDEDVGAGMELCQRADRQWNLLIPLYQNGAAASAEAFRSLGWGDPSGRRRPWSEMDADDREQALLTALTTEHFVLQTSAAATINEGGSRSSIFLLSVSTSLVALGFSTGSPDVFGLMAAVLMPTLFVLGCFTIVRLTDTSVENLEYLRRISRIRTYYATLSPEAPQFFPADQAEAEAALTGTRSRPVMLLFTMASMIGTVTAVLGGAGLALLLDVAIGLPRIWAVLAGVTLAVLLLVGAVAYQGRRFSTTFPE